MDLAFDLTEFELHELNKNKRRARRKKKFLKDLDKKNIMKWAHFSPYYLRDEKYVAQYKEEIVPAHTETRHYYFHNPEKFNYYDCNGVAHYGALDFYTCEEFVPKKKRKILVHHEYVPCEPYIQYAKKSSKASKYAKRMTNRKIRNDKPDAYKELYYVGYDWVPTEDGNAYGLPSSYRKAFDYAWEIW